MMQENNSGISIVIPAYKAEKFIIRTIDSCLSEKQNIPIEIIIVEDGTYDNTRKKIEEKYFKYDYINIYTFDKNKGACIARNFGLDKAKYPYIIFLDADDFFEDGVLKGMYDTINNKNTSLVISNTVKRWENKEIDMNIPNNTDNIDIMCRFISGRAGPPPCGILWKKDEVIRIGKWNESYSKNQDGELLIRALLNNCTVSFNSVGQSVYWQYFSINRVSKRIDKKALKDQEKLELYISEYINKDKKYQELEKCLNAYRFGVMVRVLMNSMEKEVLYWEAKFKSKSIQEFKFSSKKKFMAFIFYKVFGKKVLYKVLKILKISII